jgi:hypothetical protein
MNPKSNGSRIAKPAAKATPPPPMTPCEALAAAKQQMYLLAAGQAIVAVETPQLGRVEYSKGSVTDLQRVIDGLAAECAASLGTTTGTGRRKPISIEAWP